MLQTKGTEAIWDALGEKKNKKKQVYQTAWAATGRAREKNKLKKKKHHGHW